MKKFFIILAIICIATTSNAQFFMGGDLGFALRSEKAKVDDPVTTHQFIFGATSANILSVGHLKIGAIFKF